MAATSTGNGIRFESKAELTCPITRLICSLSPHILLPGWVNEHHIKPRAKGFFAQSHLPQVSFEAIRRDGFVESLDLHKWGLGVCRATQKDEDRPVIDCVISCGSDVQVLWMSTRPLDTIGGRANGKVAGGCIERLSADMGIPQTRVMNNVFFWS
jgi:hypothetical protein